MGRQRGLSLRALNFSGFHLHFLTGGREYGGHLHECRTGRVQIGIQIDWNWISP
jgi:alpha-acetolactate decarboxylase